MLPLNPNNQSIVKVVYDFLLPSAWSIMSRFHLTLEAQAKAMVVADAVDENIEKVKKQALIDWLLSEHDDNFYNNAAKVLSPLISVFDDQYNEATYQKSIVSYVDAYQKIIAFANSEPVVTLPATACAVEEIEKKITLDDTEKLKRQILKKAYDLLKPLSRMSFSNSALSKEFLQEQAEKIKKDALIALLISHFETIVQKTLTPLIADESKYQLALERIIAGYQVICDFAKDNPRIYLPDHLEMTRAAIAKCVGFDEEAQKKNILKTIYDALAPSVLSFKFDESTVTSLLEAQAKRINVEGTTQEQRYGRQKTTLVQWLLSSEADNFENTVANTLHPFISIFNETYDDAAYQSAADRYAIAYQAIRNFATFSLTEAKSIEQIIGVSALERKNRKILKTIYDALLPAKYYSKKFDEASFIRDILEPQAKTITIDNESDESERYKKQKIALINLLLSNHTHDFQSAVTRTLTPIAPQNNGQYDEAAYKDALDRYVAAYAAICTFADANPKITPPRHAVMYRNAMSSWVGVDEDAKDQEREEQNNKNILKAVYAALQPGYYSKELDKKAFNVILAAQDKDKLIELLFSDDRTDNFRNTILNHLKPLVDPLDAKYDDNAYQLALAHYAAGYQEIREFAGSSLLVGTPEFTEEAITGMVGVDDKKRQNRRALKAIYTALSPSFFEFKADAFKATLQEQAQLIGKQALIDLLLSPHVYNFQQMLLKTLTPLAIADEKYDEAAYKAAADRFAKGYQAIVEFAGAEEVAELAPHTPGTEKEIATIIGTQGNENKSTIDDRIKDLIAQVQQGSFTEAALNDVWLCYFYEKHPDDLRKAKEAKIPFLAALARTNTDIKPSWFEKIFLLLLHKAFLSADSNKFFGVLEQYALARKIFLKFFTGVPGLEVFGGDDLLKSFAITVFEGHPIPIHAAVKNARMTVNVQPAISVDQHITKTADDAAAVVVNNAPLDDVKLVNPVSDLIYNYSSTDPTIMSARGEDNNTLLHTALKANNWKIAEEIIEHSTSDDLVLLDSAGLPAIYYAVQSQQHALISAILAKFDNAIVQRKQILTNGYGQPPQTLLQLAQTNNDVQTIAILQPRPNVSLGLVAELTWNQVIWRGVCGVAGMMLLSAGLLLAGLSIAAAAGSGGSSLLGLFAADGIIAAALSLLVGEEAFAYSVMGYCPAYEKLFGVSEKPAPPAITDAAKLEFT